MICQISVVFKIFILPNMSAGNACHQFVFTISSQGSQPISYFMSFHFQPCEHFFVLTFLSCLKINFSSAKLVESIRKSPQTQTYKRFIYDSCQFHFKIRLENIALRIISSALRSLTK